jgi:hypothetical protein
MKKPKKTVDIRCCVTPEQFARFTALAEDAGMSTSTWILSTVLHSLSSGEQENLRQTLKEMTSDFRRRGNGPNRGRSSKQ